jgi:hypothetical protein
MSTTSRSAGAKREESWQQQNKKPFIAASRERPIGVYRVTGRSLLALSVQRTVPRWRTGRATTAGARNCATTSLQSTLRQRPQQASLLARSLACAGSALHSPPCASGGRPNSRAET